MRDNAVMNVLFDRDGQWAVNVAADGRAQWRVSVYTDRRVEPATVDASAIVRRLAGRAVAHEVLYVNAWTRRQAVAEHYRAGRVYLIGDAAHTLTPNGGFGMNTGIADAVDFGWKVAAMRAGWGGDHLLDSYEVERKPIADRNVREATRNFDQIQRIPWSPDHAADTADGEALRARARDFIYANRLDRATHTSGVALGYRYDPSPIVCPDGTPPPPDDASDYMPTARPGSRAPHGWLGDGRSTLDLFGPGFLLLDFGAAEGAAQALEAAATSRAMPLETVRIDDPAVAEAYQSRLVLVRPDGHVAWRGDVAPGNPLAVVDRVRGAAMLPEWQP